MVASLFLDYLTKFQVLTYVGVEDFADKLSFLITVTILLLCTTIVTVKQYMMKAISCYLATHVGGKNLLDYVENHCWVEGTIWISSSQPFPQSAKDWERLNHHKLLYYQWVPFVLGLQCIMFYLPRCVWQIICYNRLGTDLHDLVVRANQAAHASAGEHEKLVQQVSKSIEQLLYHRQRMYTGSRNRYIESQAAVTGYSSAVTPRHHLSMEMQSMAELDKTPKEVNSYSDAGNSKANSYTKRHRGHQHKRAVLPEPGSLLARCCRSFCCLICDRHRGAFLCSAYLFLKLMYLGNAVGQMFLMEYFLGFLNTEHSLFGITMLRNMINGRNWENTQVFPRVAYCYTQVAHFGARNNTVTAQCVLPVNMLNEKIYVFLWWWILLVTVVTAYSLLHWCFRMISRGNAMDFVLKYLRLAYGYTAVEGVSGLSDCDDSESADGGSGNATSADPLIHEFVSSFLRRDGVFLLRMLAFNAGEIVTFEVIITLWKAYRSRMLATEQRRAKRRAHIVRNNDQLPSAPALIQGYHAKQRAQPSAGDTGSFVPPLQQFCNDPRYTGRQPEGRVEEQLEFCDAKKPHSLV